MTTSEITPADSVRRDSFAYAAIAFSDSTVACVEPKRPPPSRLPFIHSIALRTGAACSAPPAIIASAASAVVSIVRLSPPDRVIE